MQKVDDDKLDRVPLMEEGLVDEPLTPQGKKKKGKGKGKDKEEKPPQVSFFAVFRYAGWGLRLVFLIGFFFAAGSGAGMPFFSFIFQKLIDSLASSPQEVQKEVGNFATLAIFAGTVMLITCWIFTTCFMTAGDLLGATIRERLFTKMLLQELSWFDNHKPGELTSWLTSDMVHLEDALGEKLGQFIFNCFTAILAVTYGFYVSWRLTMMILACSPLLITCGAIMTVLLTKLSNKESTAYSEAGSIAQEVFSNIRTVVSFNAQQREVSRYRAFLGNARRAGIKKGWTQAISIGFTMGVIFATYALAFYYGFLLVKWKLNSGGEVIGCFFAVLMGCFMLGAAGPFAETLTKARETLTRVINLLERQSEIPLRGGKTRDVALTHSLTLKNLKFRYPSRKNHVLFDGLDLSIPKGKRLALVGHSGGGKSSVLALLERFYDPEGGDVLIDDVPLRTMDPEWWRSNVGYVTQEPQLFSCSIEENLQLGTRRDITAQEMHDACRAANIHDDIMRLPDQYDTLVGEAGSQLSGGQRQRVCIARALLADPAILLLDEATSALDRQSEKLVQDALETLMKGRTTVVIAHRLVTIKDADFIAFVKQGAATISLVGPEDPITGKKPVTVGPSSIAEIGTHDELMALGGEYFSMVQAQRAVEVDSVRAPHDDLRSSPELQDTQTKADFAGSLKNMTDRKTIEVQGGTAADKAKKRKRRAVAAKKEKEETMKGGLSRVAKMNAPEWWLLVIGVLGAAASALIYPLYAVLFSNMAKTFVDDSVPMPEREKQAAKWAFFFLGMAGYAFLANLFRTAMFAIAGERLTERLRNILFDTILQQDMSFFDDKKNESGNLCNILSKDVPQVHLVFGPTLAMYIQNILTLVAGLIISFYVLWQLALVTLSLVPLMVIAAAINIMVMQGFGNKNAGVYGEANHIAVETLQSIRVVMAFNMQERRVWAYRATLVETVARSMTRALIAGFFFGFNQLAMFSVFGVAFWYGSHLIESTANNPDPADRVGFQSVMQCTTALIFAGMGIGETSALAKSFGNAGASAKRVFDIIDRKPKIDIKDESGTPAGNKIGDLQLDSVTFTYPSRPNQIVLSNVSLGVPKGKHLALIGATGCGKSTIIQLLQRFYDPDSGNVVTGGQTLSSMNLHSYRSKIAIVQQEPVLFDETIKYNICYGTPTATDEDIHNAAKVAAIHNDIMKFPEGYYTKVGLRGGQLSGGQRQRVAIARAILQKPQILLLDEATAALDNINESEVQKALDNIIQTCHMTVVTIAHRLTTIQNADLIAVLHDGKLLECGSHQELYELNGEYRRRYDLYHGHTVDG